LVLNNPSNVSAQPDSAKVDYKGTAETGLQMPPLIIVGIPAFNEEKTIARVILGAQKNAHIVIVCDDGSTDLTAEIALKLGAVVVRHERNLGYGAALHSLFKRAKELNADILVTLDSDGQHDPSEIPLLVKPIENGLAEVVLGSRFIDKNGTADMPAYRQLGIKVITKLSNASGKDGVSDAQSGFRAYSRRAIGELGAIIESGMSASIELLRAITRSGLSVYEVPITCKYADSIGEKTSTKHPLSHGVGLIMSLVRLIVEDRPITFLGTRYSFFVCRHLVWRMDDEHICIRTSHCHKYCLSIDRLSAVGMFHVIDCNNTICYNKID